MTHETIWDFSEGLAERLLLWGALSVGSGLALAQTDDAFQGGMGQQFAGWGVIDAIIAVVGLRSGRRNRQQPNANAPARQAAEAIKLRRLLWLNTALDVGYVAGGWWLWRTRAADRVWRGHAVGIIVQGAFLFAFDLVHALKVPRWKI